MISLEEALSQPKVLALLHRVLTQKETIHEVSEYAPHGEPYVTNQYMLITVLEFIIKYAILHKDGYQFSYFIDNLVDSLANVTSYKDIIYVGNQLLASSIMDKLQLDNMTSTSNKESMIRYAYQNYIVEGYCFHSFPSRFREKIQEEGLYPSRNVFHLNEMEEVERIFHVHGVNDLFALKLQEPKQDYFYITDSPAMSYFYAIQAPEYFARFCSNGKAMNDIEKYDINAYYRKDYDACLRNVENLCNEAGLSISEKEKVLNYFQNTWCFLNADGSSPCVAFIKRKEIGRDSLKDYEFILSDAGTQDIIYSLAKVMDSRFPKDKRYSKVVPFQFELKQFPPYRVIFDYSDTDSKKAWFKPKEKVKPMKDVTVDIALETVSKEAQEKEVLQEKSGKKLQEIKKEPAKVKPAKANNHGYADIMAMCGFFLITLGLTLVIVMRYIRLT